MEKKAGVEMAWLPASRGLLATGETALTGLQALLKGRGCSSYFGAAAKDLLVLVKGFDGLRAGLLRRGGAAIQK